MSANQAGFPIAAIARVLGVSQARFYARRPRPPAARARVDEALLARIKRVPISSRQTYGAPRVDAELRATGGRHGRKRIARLMRAAGLVGAGAAARSRRSATNTPDPRPIWWSATSRQPARTSCGSPTSPRPSPGQACMGHLHVKPHRRIRGELAVARARARYTLVFGRSVRTSTMMQ